MSFGSAMQAAKSYGDDPLKAYMFRLILLPAFGGNGLSAKAVNGALGLAGTAVSVIAGGFTSIQGMGWKTEIRTVKEGGLNDREHKLPGRTICNELVFTKGMGFVDPLWEWYSLNLSGRVLRMNGLILLMPDIGTAKSSKAVTTITHAAIWHFTGAWPTVLEGVKFDASQSLLAIQSMTLAIDSIKRTLSPGSIAASVV